jgi:ABC transport system ATP-binding/permease protein
VADMMASRWAYEAMAVYQFKNNSYERPYFIFEKVEANADFKSSFLVDELNRKRKNIAENITEKSDSVRTILQKDLDIIRTSLADQEYKKGLEGFKFDQPWPLATFTPAMDKKLEEYLEGLKKYYQTLYNKAVTARETLSQKMEEAKELDYRLNDYKNRYFNESLSDLVRNISEKDRIIEFNGELIQQINPVFLSPKAAPNLSYRTHFFAPEKNLFGMLVSTYWFDILVIWLMTIGLYITLYFEVLRKLINSFDKMPGKGMLTKGLPKVNLPKKK